MSKVRVAKKTANRPLVAYVSIAKVLDTPESVAVEYIAAKAAENEAKQHVADTQLLLKKTFRAAGVSSAAGVELTDRTGNLSWKLEDKSSHKLITGSQLDSTLDSLAHEVNTEYRKLVLLDAKIEAAQTTDKGLQLQLKDKGLSLERGERIDVVKIKV
jgi:hypothetical protein